MNVAADVTEPKWSKETPRESETKFRLLFEKSPDAMLLLDGDVFVDCNQAAVEMMRCSSKEQLLALDLYDIFPERQPDGRLSSEKARDLVATAFREGSLRFEWVHRAVDGTDFPVEVLLTAIPLRGKEVLHVAWRDITERKCAEEELREREAQYRGIFESTSDGLLIFDLNGTIVEANPAACSMYGYPYEELIGLSGKDIVHPDYHHLFEDFKRQVQASGRFNAQSVDLRKGDSPINVELHGASFSYKGQPHLLATCVCLSFTYLRPALSGAIFAQTMEKADPPRLLLRLGLLRLFLGGEISCRHPPKSPRISIAALRYAHLSLDHLHPLEAKKAGQQPIIPACESPHRRNLHIPHHSLSSHDTISKKIKKPRPPSVGVELDIGGMTNPLPEPQNPSVHKCCPGATTLVKTKNRDSPQ